MYMYHSALLRIPEKRSTDMRAGEYVFDHSWAHSCARLTAQRYYPKLQSCVPFTPATGARLLLASGPNVAAVRRALATTLKTITGELAAALPLPSMSLNVTAGRSVSRCCTCTPPMGTV